MLVSSPRHLHVIKNKFIFDVKVFLVLNKFI